MKSRILVCEDDIQFNDMTAELIAVKIPEAQIVQVYNRDDAMDALKKYYFGIALIDLNLEDAPNTPWKKMGGVKIASHLKNMNYGTTAIIITGSDDTRLAFELARDFGVQDYVAKGPNAFEEMIAMCLSYYGKDNCTVPEGLYAQKLLSGIDDGIARDIWYSNCLSDANIDGNSLFGVFNKIAHLYYPFVLPNEGGGFTANSNEKSITGEFWSLRQGMAVKVIIKNKREAFSPLNEGTVLHDDTFKNARFTVTQLNNDRNEYK